MLYYWGPRLWYFIHTVSFTYPDNPSKTKMDNFKQLYTKFIPSIIPCNYCKRHYNEFIYKYDITPYLKNKFTLVDWCRKVHNNVNKRHKKKLYSQKEIFHIYYNKKVDNSILFTLMKYYCDWCRRDRSQLDKFKRVLNIIIQFFPCQKSKIKIINFFSKSKELGDLFQKIIYLTNNPKLDFLN